MTTLRTHALPIVFLIALCVLTAGLKFDRVGTKENSDYLSYIATAQLLSGQQASVAPERILKPLAPLGVAAFAPVFGYHGAFLFEVAFFYIAFAFALYALAYIFFEDKWLAFIATLLGALSYPILRYGLDLYTETGAQFFYILSLVFTLLYIKAPSRKLLMWNGLVLGIGLLWKEYSLVAGLAFGLILLFERAAWRAKAANLALLALISLAPSVLVQFWVYFAYHYTYFNWYATSAAAGFATQFTAHNIIKSVAALLGLAWLLVPFGIARTPLLSRAQAYFLAAAIPSSLFALAWGFVSSRLFYVMAPAFILLAVMGLGRWPKWAQVLIVVVTIIANIAWLLLALVGAPA